MIREFLEGTDFEFFKSIDDDCLQNPTGFLEEMVGHVGVYAPALLQFIKWGYEVFGAEDQFLHGALVTLEALRRFDRMRTGDLNHFLAQLVLVEESFCEAQGAALCNCPVLFYERTNKFVYNEQNDIRAVVDFLYRKIETAPAFRRGAYTMLEFFFRLEEAGKVLPETRFLN